MKAETSKTTTCTRFILTGVGTGPIIRGPWHRACLTESIARTWPMNAVVLERVYALSEMPRLQDLLADARGVGACPIRSLRKSMRGRAGATVTVEAAPQLVCQRCLQGFAFAGRGQQ